MKVRCSKPFLLCVVLLFLLDHRGFYLLVFAGILIHESGHLLAMTWMRCNIEQLELRMSGLNLKYGDSHLSYGKDAFIALAGPLANLLTAAILILYSHIDPAAKWDLMIGVQVLLAGFNLLPALPMDGGRVLQAFISWRWGMERGEYVLQATTAVVSAILLGVGIYACKAPWHNPTLLITACLLLVSLLRRDESR